MCQLFLANMVDLELELPMFMIKKKSLYLYFVKMVSWWVVIKSLVNWQGVDGWRQIDWAIVGSPVQYAKF